jgi:Fusaric acid resistance protein-like
MNMRMRTTTINRMLQWAECVDPGAHRRIKGLRLVTAYGIAALLGFASSSRNMPGATLGFLAGNIALWASFLEVRAARFASTRDLLVLCFAAAVGAISVIGAALLLRGADASGPELVIATGAFLVGYLNRFGAIGKGIGAQIFLGQIFAYACRLTWADLVMVAVATAIASIASVVPRLLSGPGEKPVLARSIVPVAGIFGLSPELVMGLQASLAVVAITVANHLIGMQESVWAISACTFVIAGSVPGTADRVRRRILGTIVGVPIGLLCMPLIERYPITGWIAAAGAMIVYTVASPERYDIACGAVAFALMVTLTASGIRSPLFLSARLWETAIGATVGLVLATVVLPLRPIRVEV